MDFSSKLLENAVNEVARLPGIGKRTALRLVLHLLKQPAENTSYLTEALQHLRTDVKSCEKCYNISDTILCEICSNPNRNPEIICVVEEIRDSSISERGARIDDKRSEELSFEISKKIEEEMTYPGQVKVTVIRETRAVNIAS